MLCMSVLRHYWGEKEHKNKMSTFLAYTYLPKGKVQKKKIEEKNLTSVSFTFPHTYTAVKTNSFRFFPQAYMENFEKCAKTGNMGTLGGGGGANSPL